MDGDERAIYVVLVLIGGPTLALDVVRGGALEAGATLASLMVITGTAALVRGWLGRPRMPAARARYRRASRPRRRYSRPVSDPRPPRTPLRAYVVALIAVTVATAIELVAAPYTSHADQAMGYMLAILVAALGGRGAGLTAAVLAAAAFDFFFVAPRHTFAVADRSFLITFGVMLAIGAAIGSLVNRARLAQAESRERELRAKAEELRSTLLSSVSHDLRTPLAVITGMATSLRDGAQGAQREELDTIVGEAQRLSRILTNLLAITKVETGAQPRREWVPLDELIGSALARLEPELAGHPLALDVADELAHVDPILAEQLLVNLVENAARHGAEGCAIEVHARRDGAAALIEINDDGPGLPAGSPDQVFEKFFRGRGAKAGGVGLGLTVCRAIAVAHGGLIEAASRDGGGASFRVRFPDDGAPPQLDDAPELLARAS